MTHPVHILSLGPGDPELVTLKTLRRLEESDSVYVPVTIVPSTGHTVSRATAILDALGIERTKLRPFEVPMAKDRTAAENAYRALAPRIREEQQAGRRIAVAAEGDAGLYASVHYVGDLLRGSGIEVHYTAGIPALIAAAAAAGLHLVKGDESLLLLPSVSAPEQLLAPLAEGRTVAVMKLSQSESAVKTAVERGEEYTWHYFENIGTEKEFLTASTATILARRFPYFSLLIARR